MVQPLSAGSANNVGAHTTVPSGGDDDDDCFDIDLDGEPPDGTSAACKDLQDALEFLNDSTTDTVLDGLRLVEQHLGSEAWRMRFLNAGMLPPVCILVSVVHKR